MILPEHLTETRQSCSILHTCMISELGGLFLFIAQGLSSFSYASASIIYYFVNQFPGFYSKKVVSTKVHVHDESRI